MPQLAKWTLAKLPLVIIALFGSHYKQYSSNISVFTSTATTKLAWVVLREHNRKRADFDALMIPLAFTILSAA